MSNQQSLQYISEILEALGLLLNALETHIKGGMDKYKDEYEDLLNSKYDELF